MDPINNAKSRMHYHIICAKHKPDKRHFGWHPYDVLTHFLALSMLWIHVYVVWLKIGLLKKTSRTTGHYVVKNITWKKAWGYFNVTRIQTIENIPIESLLSKTFQLFITWQHNTMHNFTMPHKFPEGCFFTASNMTAKISLS